MRKRGISEPELLCHQLPCSSQKFTKIYQNVSFTFIKIYCVLKKKHSSLRFTLKNKFRFQKIIRLVTESVDFFPFEKPFIWLLLAPPISIRWLAPSRQREVTLRQLVPLSSLLVSGLDPSAGSIFPTVWCLGEPTDNCKIFQNGHIYVTYVTEKTYVLFSIVVVVELLMYRPYVLHPGFNIFNRTIRNNPRSFHISPITI